MNRALKLRAIDAEDLQVVAGCLQDAIVPICEMCFISEERRFVMVVNRFKWECCDESLPAPNGDASYDGEEDTPAPYERTNCGVQFDNVTAVKTRNLDLRDRHQILSLLTMETQDGAVILHFSGGACIRLESAGWECRIADLGEPWPTLHRPCHPCDDVPADGRPAA